MKELKDSEYETELLKKLFLFLFTMNDVDIDKFQERINVYLPEDERSDIMATTAERLLEKGIKQGIEKGIEKGIKKGRKEGVEKGVITTAVNMLKEGSEVEFISRVTGLPIEKIIELNKR